MLTYEYFLRHTCYESSHYYNFGTCIGRLVDTITIHDQVINLYPTHPACIDIHSFRNALTS